MSGAGDAWRRETEAVLTQFFKREGVGDAERAALVVAVEADRALVVAARRLERAEARLTAATTALVVARRRVDASSETLRRIRAGA